MGLSSAKEVSESSIQLLDPVTINKKPPIKKEQYIAAPLASAKSAVTALATVAKTLLQTKFTGTVIIAFTTLELLKGKGLESVVGKYGSFDESSRKLKLISNTTYTFTFRRSQHYYRKIRYDQV